MLALGTDKPIRPLHEGQVVVTRLVGWEEILEIHHTDRISLHWPSYYVFAAGDAKQICQMLNIIEDVTLESAAIKKKLEEEFVRHAKFMGAVYGKNVEEKTLPRVDKRKYARYLLTEGTTQEKRELLASLTTKLILKDGILKPEKLKTPKR